MRNPVRNIGVKRDIRTPESRLYHRHIAFGRARSHGDIGVFVTLLTDKTAYLGGNIISFGVRLGGFIYLHRSALAVIMLTLCTEDIFPHKFKLGIGKSPVLREECFPNLRTCVICGGNKLVHRCIDRIEKREISRRFVLGRERYCHASAVAYHNFQQFIFIGGEAFELVDEEFRALEKAVFGGFFCGFGKVGAAVLKAVLFKAFHIPRIDESDVLCFRANHLIE